jgi:hypothetical protein
MVLPAGVSALEGTRKKVEAGRITFRWLRSDATWTPLSKKPHNPVRTFIRKFRQRRGNTTRAGEAVQPQSASGFELFVSKHNPQWASTILNG